MKLLSKLNLTLVGVASVGLVAAGLLSYGVMQRNAREVVLQNARIMLQTALAMRHYTVTQIRPLLADKVSGAFLPQTVPAYAATENFEFLRKKYPEYTYKEAALNPTNLRDRATDWEADLIDVFRNQTSQSEIVGVRDTPRGRSLYLAQPITIKDASCLTCHSTPDAAPQSMLEIYGDSNGFGWEMGETVGSQIVSVPMEVPVRLAQHAFFTLLASLAVVFIVSLLVLNLMLRRIVIKPLKDLATMADEISRGNMDIDEFTLKSKDEVGTLAASFNRMRRSLKTAMNMLDD